MVIGTGAACEALTLAFMGFDPMPVRHEVETIPLDHGGP